MSRALYRKYRPRSLSEVVGQPQVSGPLANSLASGKVSHAYIFVGPRGTGKTSVARILAHEVNHFPYELEDEYVDIVEIDGASNRGIDSVRELREKATVAPTKGKYKVYIIDEVHMFTKEASNALLKTLEEPPAHVIFIMATTELHKVPITILSRAQTFHFNLADSTLMQKFLREVSDKEKIPITDDALSIIVRRGGGSFRDSLSLLDQISTLATDSITAEAVISAFGLPTDAAVGELIANYEKADLAAMVNTLKRLLTSGAKPETIAEDLVAEILEHPKPNLLPMLSGLTSVTSPFPEAKLLLALTKDLQSTPSIPGIATTPATPAASAASAAPAAPSAPSPTPPVAAPAADVEPAPSRPTPSPAAPSPDPPVTSDTSSKTPSEPSDFSWDDFLDRVAALSEAIYKPLQKSTYKVSGRTLHIYPKNKVTGRVLAAKNNLNHLVSCAGGFTVQIETPGAPTVTQAPGQNTASKTPQPSSSKPQTTPRVAPKDSAKTSDSAFDTSKISAIIGGEVKNYDGDTPF